MIKEIFVHSQAIDFYLKKFKTNEIIVLINFGEKNQCSDKNHIFYNEEIKRFPRR